LFHLLNSRRVHDLSFFVHDNHALSRGIILRDNFNFLSLGDLFLNDFFLSLDYVGRIEGVSIGLLIGAFCLRGLF
jgi:hypothetical protein